MAIEGNYLNITGMQETYLLSQLKLSDIIEQFAKLNVSFIFQSDSGKTVEVRKDQLKEIIGKISDPTARINLIRFINRPDTLKRLAKLPPGMIHKVNLYKASIGQDPIKELEAPFQQAQAVVKMIERPLEAGGKLDEASKLTLDQQTAPEAGYEIGPMAKILGKIQGPDGKEQYPYRDIIEILGRKA